MSNLLREILDRIEFERLIEEGRDPVEVLRYKFKDVPSQVIDKVVDIDPTKKKSYSQWLLSKWRDEKDVIMNNLDNGRIEKLFQYYKTHDDVQIKECPSVKEGLNFVVGGEGSYDDTDNNSILSKSSEPMTLLKNRYWEEEVPSDLANDFDIVFDEDNWIIAVPNTYEAECKLGENTTWCTAGGRSNEFSGGRSYYNHYLNDYGGKYYVNFDMSEGESRFGVIYPFKRYQFHFETKQFMDSDDEMVSMDEIGIPDSALEFYASEGYDTDDFEDEEMKLDRYWDQRTQDSVYINDELYLNTSFDEDYDYVAPTESSDFYLFSNTDDRDPLSYEEIPNPHAVDNVVISKREGFCVLKVKYGEGVLVAMEVGDYHQWEAEPFDHYKLLGDTVFGVSEGKWTFFSRHGKDVFYDFNVNSCEDIFVNEYCTKAFVEETGEDCYYVEAIADGFHSLLLVYSDDTAEMVIKRDVPINGKYFVVNENGFIEGQYRKYMAYYEDAYDESERGEIPDWDLVSTLPTGDFLISKKPDTFYGCPRKYNIFRKGLTKPLLDEWMDEYQTCADNLYVFKGKDKELSVKRGCFSRMDGHQVGGWYDQVDALSLKNRVISCKVGTSYTPVRVDLIDAQKCDVIAQFQNVLSIVDYNNKIIVYPLDGSESKAYDLVEGKFCFDELEHFFKLDEYNDNGVYGCKFVGTQEFAIFDLNSQNILVRGIKGMSYVNQSSKFALKLEKTNGKYNVFDIKNLKEMLQFDVDEVVDFSSYLGILIYRVDNRYYPFDFRHGNVMINPNGIPFKVFIETSADRLACTNNGYTIIFANNRIGNYTFYAWRNDNNFGEHGKDITKGETPQEVINMCNLIYGTQESITNRFNDYIRRLDEAKINKL